MFGLSFLNTPFLIFLSSLVLPIIIYLITKKKPQKIIFSSIRFIKESVQQRKKRINLKNLLLLLIRLLILLFVILGLSRPVIKTQKGYFSSNHPKTAIAIIIDNSYSMDYLVDTQTELDKAKEIAKEINGILNSDDIIILVTRDDKWNKINSGINYGKLQENIIEKIGITPKAINIGSALNVANEYLKQSQYINKEIYIITDFQKEDYPKNNPYPICIIKTSNEKYKKNIAPISSYVSTDFTGDKKRKKIRFNIKNFSNVKMENLICRLIVDDKTVSEKVITLSPFQEKSLYFDTVVNKEGWHNGYVKVKNERLEYDNKNYFSFFLKTNPKVAIISAENEFPLPFVSILEIYTNDIKVLHEEEINFNIFDDYDNVIVYKPTYSDKLKELLTYKDVSKILFILDKDDNDDIKSLYENIFNIKIGDYYSSEQNLTVNKINRYEKITRIFKNSKDAKINYFYKLMKNKAKTLLAASNFPVAIENKDNSILWLFSINEDNPFVVSSVFPVFAYNCLMGTSGFDNLGNDIVVGDKITVKSKKLVLPNGKMVYAENGVYLTNQAGIYKADNKFIAVNLDYKESDYNKKELSKSNNITVTFKKWKNYIFRNGYGKDIWKYFFLIALILYILEMIIVKMEEKR